MSMITINLSWKGVESVRMVADSVREEQKEVLLMPLVQHYARALNSRIAEQREKHQKDFSDDESKTDDESK
jgi:hypothetical protein